MSSSAHAEILDLAVIGAGVSGLYSAWRWLRSTPGQSTRTVVFELSGRVGGRLLSVAPPGAPQARVELGGMRFISSQTAVSQLVQRLGLQTESFTVVQPGNVAYLRGRHLRTSDLQNPASVPYDIPEADAEGFSTGFPALAAERYLRKVLHQPDVNLKTVDWDAVAQTGHYEGHRVRDLPMRYVFNREVSHESFQFAQDTSGYDSIFYTWNAADGFPWNIGDYGADIQYYRLKDGYETLPKALYQAAVAAGAEVRLHHRLVSFDEATLPDGTRGLRLRMQHDGQEHECLCRRLVLAMPRRSLDLLAPQGPLLDPSQRRVRELIASVQPIPLFKLALCYRQRWWEPLGITQGQSVTDLPIRQCYYWPMGSSDGPGAILIYNDGLDREYWAELCRHPAVYANDEGNQPSREWREHPAPALMVQEAHRQLMDMHGLTDHPDRQPYAAAFQDWGTDPFGGGANFWPVGVDSHAVGRDIVHPRPDVPVFICGEAYSHAQGWVEGALQTAEDMLQRCWGLPADSTSP